MTTVESQWRNVAKDAIPTVHAAVPEGAGHLLSGHRTRRGGSSLTSGSWLVSVLNYRFHATMTLASGGILATLQNSPGRCRNSADALSAISINVH